MFAANVSSIDNSDLLSELLRLSEFEQVSICVKYRLAIGTSPIFTVFLSKKRFTAVLGFDLSYTGLALVNRCPNSREPSPKIHFSLPLDIFFGEIESLVNLMLVSQGSC